MHFTAAYYGKLRAEEKLGVRYKSQPFVDWMEGRAWIFHVEMGQVLTRVKWGFKVMKSKSFQNL